MYRSSQILRPCRSPLVLLKRNQKCYFSSQQVQQKESTESAQNTISVCGSSYTADEYTNVTSGIMKFLDENPRLYQKTDHPLNILRRKIESWFSEQAKPSLSRTYAMLDAPHSPVVSTRQNFDDLLVPKDHISRSLHDSYYVNQNYLLRAHTSAHQVQMLQAGHRAFLLTGDVYRRDSVDPSHYPVFHQMEGVCVFDMKQSQWQQEVSKETASLAELVPDYTKRTAGDIGFTINSEEIQSGHNADDVNIVAEHLRVNLEGMVRKLLDHTNTAQLPIRWVNAYFPFTSPSWEMEIFYRGQWLEVCGCGLVQDPILRRADLNHHIGWAFGLGLERIAMTLFDIPDIRLFWSKDPRFTQQFKNGQVSSFKPFSKYPATYKDISFWTPSSFHQNGFCELVRSVCGDLVEDVQMVDEFVHPKTQRRSQCYRILYRSMERTLTNEEVDKLQNVLCQRVVEEMNVQLR